MHTDQLSLACQDPLPAGMKALSDYLHSKGLLLGIYGDSGEAGRRAGGRQRLALPWPIGTLSCQPASQPACASFVCRPVHLPGLSGVARPRGGGCTHVCRLG